MSSRTLPLAGAALLASAMMLPCMTNAALALSDAASRPRPHPAITDMMPPGMICRDCAAPDGVSAPIPPAHFDPLTATDDELAFFGFPPRPDARAAPGDYAFWQKVVTLPVTRIKPRLLPSRLRHGPANIVSTAEPQAPPGATGVTSTNWSGYSVVDSNNPFKAKNTTVYGSFVVPYPRQAFNTCNGTWDYSSPWVGLDGWGSPDVLQAGMDIDAYCSGNTTKQTYAAWYEWYPAGSVYLSNFPIARGDVIYVYVWPTSTTAGDYYIADVTQNESSSLSFNAPNGTTLVGNSVEWITEWFEGPMITNYLDIPWYYAKANIGNGSKQYSPSKAPTGTIYSISLVDSNNNNLSIAYTTPNNALDYTNPSNTVYYYAGSTLWFQTTGSAY